MVLYIYKYWFKMLKRWNFPPLIKARASSTNCTMGNLTYSRHATYLHIIYAKSREIHILSTIQILGICHWKTFQPSWTNQKPLRKSQDITLRDSRTNKCILFAIVCNKCISCCKEGHSALIAWAVIRFQGN